MAAVGLYAQEPEARLLAAFIDRLEERTVVDVGAERGSFAAEMLRAGSDAVHLFEPEPTNVAFLRERFADDERVTVHDFAISDSDEALELHISIDPDGNPVTFGHTVLSRPDTDEIAWRDTIAVDARSLASLVETGELPSRVGILKVDTEGHDLAVVAGMGKLECDVVMVEHWADLPRSLGPCPWTAEEMVSALRQRGFSHYAFVAHRGEFVIVQWDDANVPVGHMGNLIFLHERVVDRLLPDVAELAASLAGSAVEVGEGYATEAAERLVVIGELKRERATAERPELIKELEQPEGAGHGQANGDAVRARANWPPRLISPAEFWPPAEAFWAPGVEDQWNDGNVRCTAVAICDEDGSTIRAAHQGQPVHLLFEFAVDAEIGLPSGWFELRDASGLLVHGNGSFDDGWTVRIDGATDIRLRYRFVVYLDVAPGEYFVTVGLSSTSEEAYVAHWYAPDPDTWPPHVERQGRPARYRPVGLPEERFASHISQHCRVEARDTIAVGFEANGRRSSTGLVRLPGAGTVTVETAPDSRRRKSRKTRSSTPPAIVHITHYKAGSQWIYAILRSCVPERIAQPDARSGHFRYWPPEPGKVYPTVYLTRQQFDEVRLPPDCRTFVVIRDLRDTLISSYFSLIKTHGMADRPSFDLRRLLTAMPVEDGLLYLMDHWLADSAQIQLSWLEAGEPLVRYEDILERDVEVLEEVLLDRCELGVSRDEFRWAVAANRFERVSEGHRQRGEEDQAAHMRKGVAGDWQNHFTDRVVRAFKARYGGVLVATGYEEDLDW